MAQACAVDRTFDAEHQPLVVLEIVANMAAGDHSLRCLAERTRRQLIVVRYPGPGDGVFAPGVADLASNIEAVPSKDRNWWWQRCRLCREGCSGKGGCGGERAGAGHGSFVRHSESSI